MTQTDQAIYVARNARLIRVAGAGPQDTFAALRAWGVRESVAAAVSVGLVTVRMRA